MKHKNLLKALVTTGVFALFLSALVVLKPETASASPATFKHYSHKATALKTFKFKPKLKATDITCTTDPFNGSYKYNKNTNTIYVKMPESEYSYQVGFSIDTVNPYIVEVHDIDVAPMVKVERTEVTKINRKIARNGRRAEIRFKEVKDAAGYQIQYSQDKSMKDAKIKNWTPIRIPSDRGYRLEPVTVKNLNPSEKLYVRVRAYDFVEDSGRSKRCYGKWSKKFKALSVRQG